MSSFAASTFYRSWITRLKQPWMGVVGKRVWGAFSAALGDNTVDWLNRSLLEAFPEYASDPAITLIGSERQLPQALALSETVGQWATRLTGAVDIWRFSRTPIGLLVALYRAGINNVRLVQQNGVQYTLTTPLNADITTNLVKGVTGETSVIQNSIFAPYTRTIPVGTKWWYFSPNTDFCSRYAILIPRPTSSRYIMSITFTGVEDGSVAHPWPTVTWPTAFADTTYAVVPGIPNVTDGAPPLGVFAIGGAGKTTTTVKIGASGPWTGTLTVMGYALGSDPMNPTGLLDIALASRTIRKWGPAKATCTGVYVLNSGRYIGWPINTIGDMSGTFGTSNVTKYPILSED